jgi:REP element-mobilizing transposase RayT
MNRVWLLTWTTYGTWLPGDERGFVSNVRDGDGPEIKHNTPGTPYDAKQRGLQIAAREQMLGQPVWLTIEQAELLAAQFRETVAFRNWSLLALAIMANHVHLVVRVPDDPEPSTLLRDFKSYGSRRLNQRFGKPTSGTWWTASGSRRKLPDERAVQAAIRYVQNQQRPLVVWIPGVSGVSGEPEPSGAGFSKEQKPPADAGGAPGGAPG